MWNEIETSARITATIGLSSVLLSIVLSIPLLFCQCWSLGLRPAFLNAFATTASVVPMGLTGVVAGYLTGQSREPAVGAAIPAVLTFLGLVIVYIIDAEKLKAARVGVAVATFSLQLLLGVELGATSREVYDAYVSSAAYRKFTAYQDFEVQNYRHALGLPPEPRSEKASEGVTEHEQH